ncbi:hypothetical protein E2C01_019098 [Portunus trituberculatus]|uniref:Uncharacterized protein n=1 Tax=Portunus trituberculatus TaxID=210409 RepID=A0A5B7DYC2_PORTR|nr:hypothetical protein [Portunus trituberculatus]
MAGPKIFEVREVSKCKGLNPVHGLSVALGEDEEDEPRVEVEGVTGAGVPEGGGVVGVEVVEATREVPLEGFGVGEEEEVGAALRACSAKPMTWSAWLRTSSVGVLCKVEQIKNMKCVSMMVNVVLSINRVNSSSSWTMYTDTVHYTIMNIRGTDPGIGLPEPHTSMLRGRAGDASGLGVMRDMMLP